MWCKDDFTGTLEKRSADFTGRKGKRRHQAARARQVAAQPRGAKIGEAGHVLQVVDFAVSPPQPL